MLNRSLIETQLRRLRASLQRLGQLANLGEREFLAEADHFAIGEHHFRRAMEVVFDIGRHLIARCGQVTPRELYGRLPDDLPQFENFAVQIEAFLEVQEVRKNVE